MGFLGGLGRSKYIPLEAPERGVAPSYAKPMGGDRSIRRLLSENVRRAANTGIAFAWTTTANPLVDDELSRAGKDNFDEIAKELLRGSFDAGCFLGVEEAMNRSRRPGFIESNHAGLYADMRAQAANAPGELSEWSAYMFDYGYYAARTGKGPDDNPSEADRSAPRQNSSQQHALDSSVPTRNQRFAQRPDTGKTRHRGD